MSDTTPHEPSPERAGLAAVLALTPLGDDRFAAPVMSAERERLFGGQVASQCLYAAGQTVDADRLPHSLHLYFTRRGRPGEELVIEVDWSREGRAFAMRHVRAMQGGAPILEMMASFHTPEPGADHHFVDLPDLPDPDDLREVDLPISVSFDIRPVHSQPDAPFPPRLYPFWIRLREQIADESLTRACVLTYLSDIALMGVAKVPDVELDWSGAGSLDHAIWFHRPHDPAEWLLYTADPISNTSARGFARGQLHSRTGGLVASIAQEALLRSL